jgi:anion-transporting  ArsA/GET3 family ATPase
MDGPLSQRLIFVTGKGGVGKSAVSAALALAFARKGERTLVCELNTPHERVSSLLNHGSAGEEIAPLEENLYAVNVRTESALHEYVLMTLKFERLYKLVFENRVVKYFLRFIPSLQELVLLGKVLFNAKEQEASGRFRFDRVIVDAPSTGHALTLLRVPQVLLDSVPPGPLANDVTWMRDLLVDPAFTTSVLVSLPEEMPVNETLQLAEGLKGRVGLHVSGLVLNAFDGSRFTAHELTSLEAYPALLARARSVEARAAMSKEAEATLAHTGLPLYRVPRLYRPEFNRGSIEAMAEALKPLLEGGPA